MGWALPFGGIDAKGMRVGPQLYETGGMPMTNRIAPQGK